MEVEGGAEGDTMETEESGDPDDDPEDPNGDEGDKPLDSNDYAEECYRELTLMGPFPWHSAENRRIFSLYKRVNERDTQAALIEWCRRAADFPSDAAVKQRWDATAPSSRVKVWTALHKIRMANPVLRFGEPPRYAIATLRPRTTWLSKRGTKGWAAV